jgi:3-carboxy-cis,cis-muconate cycloisomerase
VLLDDLAAAADAAAALARAHRATPTIGRTLMQQARADDVRAQGRGLDAGARHGREASTPSGRRAARRAGGHARRHRPERARALRRRARARGAALPWHTDRTRIGELAGALGIACGAIAKAAGDVVLLAQTEVGEVREAAPGGSSSMPHKRNPVAAISARACARQAPGLVATLLASMEQEHERAAGAWHAEWAPLRALLIARARPRPGCGRACRGLEVDASACAPTRLPARPRRAVGERARAAGRAPALDERAYRLVDRAPPTARRRPASRRPRARRSAP